MIMSKVFDKVIYVGYIVCVTIMIVCTLAIVMEANAQTMDHDSVHDIMELSNPICYIDGKITKVKVDTDCHECDARSIYRWLILRSIHSIICGKTPAHSFSTITLQTMRSHSCISGIWVLGLE